MTDHHDTAGGALGYFEVTDHAAPFCKAAFLSHVGKRAPALVRFTNPATVRGPRGFALRLFTDEGEYDVVGSHSPVAFTRDGDVPWRHCAPPAEAAHQLAILMSDRGTPRSWRHMHLYSGRTFSWLNASGELFWVKYHFKTEQGIEPWAPPTDADIQRRDLRLALARGETPSWRFEIQLMPRDEAARYRVDPFDRTKVWPHADYPTLALGRLVLERHAPLGRLGLEPSKFVPGIGPAPRGALRLRVEGDDHVQPRCFWRDVLSDAGRARLVSNLAREQPGTAAYWAAVDPELGARVAATVEAPARVS
jgi:catalase